jgi:hypothetical protein
MGIQQSTNVVGSNVMQGGADCKGRGNDDNAGIIERSIQRGWQDKSNSDSE